MLYTVIRILVIALGCTAAGFSSVHLLQSQRYQNPALRKELRRQGGSVIGPNVLIAAAATLLNWYLPVLLSMAIQKEQFRENLSNWLMLALFAGTCAVVHFQRRAIPQRKPFGWTRRVLRLLGAVLLLNGLGAWLLHVLSLSPYLMFAAVDYAVLLAAIIMRPIEDKINARFYNAARKKIAAQKGLIRIGITGSFGKTETKLILTTLLREKYKVLSTPPSYSTVMGVTRVINDELLPEHQVFIAEMGAQQKGEIKEIARLVRPQMGAISCIGDAHLDSFGSLEAAAQTKYELIQCLPEKGIAFFGADGGFGDRLYGLCKKEKYRAGAGEDCYMRAEQVETGAKGTRFKLVCSDGEQVWVQTRLLGSYSVRNIALAAAMARKLGLSMEEIGRGVEKVKPIRHRLRLLPGAVNVIDDSLNTNPEAAAEALKVLCEFPGRRILVTAGLTELEKDVAAKNYAFGTQINGCADYVILVNPEDTREVMRALMDTGFPKASVRMVREGEDAAALVNEIATEGDSVLYEGFWPEEEE